MLLNQIQTALTFRELINLASRSSLKGLEPEEVITVLNEFGAHLSRQGFRKVEGSREVVSAKDATIRGQRFSSALLKIWEMARRELKGEQCRKIQWRAVMATCNALYEQLEGKKTQVRTRVAA